MGFNTLHIPRTCIVGPTSAAAHGAHQPQDDAHDQQAPTHQHQQAMTPIHHQAMTPALAMMRQQMIEGVHKTCQYRQSFKVPQDVCAREASRGQGKQCCSALTVALDRVRTHTLAALLGSVC